MYKNDLENEVPHLEITNTDDYKSESSLKSSVNVLSSTKKSVTQDIVRTRRHTLEELLKPSNNDIDDILNKNCELEKDEEDYNK